MDVVVVFDGQRDVIPPSAPGRDQGKNLRLALLRPKSSMALGVGVTLLRTVEQEAEQAMRQLFLDLFLGATRCGSVLMDNKYDDGGMTMSKSKVKLCVVAACAAP